MKSKDTLKKINRKTKYQGIFDRGSSYVLYHKGEVYTNKDIRYLVNLKETLDNGKKIKLTTNEEKINTKDKEVFDNIDDIDDTILKEIISYKRSNLPALEVCKILKRTKSALVSPDLIEDILKNNITQEV